MALELPFHKKAVQCFVPDLAADLIHLVFRGLVLELLLGGFLKLRVADRNLLVLDELVQLIQ